MTPRPNGSRLSCGRLARRRKSSERTLRARQGTTQRLPLKRSPPGSFKRLLGGIAGARGLEETQCGGEDFASPPFLSRGSAGG